MGGPLSGVRVLELGGIGPGPFAAMMLSDMGAEVVRIDRKTAVADDGGEDPSRDLLNRGKSSLVADLKHPAGLGVALRLVEWADILIEGFRPGVTERLGIGPKDCLRRNPRLVYGRITGWGQDGPYATMAGHDINYIALSGTLSLIGRTGEPPVPPANLLGDFGGGGMLMAFGAICALLETRSSGEGQVIDAAMVDGSALLATFIHSHAAANQWNAARGSNLLDTGAYFYEVYETADNRFVSIGSLEPQFYAELVRLMGLDANELPDPRDRQNWPVGKEKLANLFRQKTRGEWCSIMEGTDVCFAPVLSLEEAPHHPHNRHRQTFVESAGTLQPAPAPRFSRTPVAIASPPPQLGQDSDTVLAKCGFSDAEIESLRALGAVA